MQETHVVVTGASAGIGLALARAFARPDRALTLVARRRELLVELQAKLACKTQVIEADLTRADDPIAWLSRAEDTFGPTEILINNAGASVVEPVEGVQQAELRRLFQLNVHTPLAAMHHVLPAMLARKHGTIVNIASAAAFLPAPYFCHYTATKAALAGFSESLRMEVRRRGVRVVTVYPGPIHTPMGDRNWEQFKPSLAQRLSPVGDADVLARMVARAADHGRARVIYPRSLRLLWWFPGIARTLAAGVVPEHVGTKTPPVGGDRVA